MSNLFPFQIGGSPSTKAQLYRWQIIASAHNAALLALYVAVIALVWKALT